MKDSISTPVVAAPSLMYGNKFYLFRINGVEIEVDIIIDSEGNQKAISSKPMLRSEWDYFNGMVLGKKIKALEIEAKEAKEYQVSIQSAMNFKK